VSFANLEEKVRVTCPSLLDSALVLAVSNERERRTRQTRVKESSQKHFVSYVGCYFAAPAAQEFLVDFTLNSIEVFITVLGKKGRIPLATLQMCSAQIVVI
jgi:hypothetical protein